MTLKYKTKNDVIKELDLIFKKYKEYLCVEISNDGNINYKNLLEVSILNRCSAIIEGYKSLLYSNNLMVLNGLTRMQIDNCIFIHGVKILYEKGFSIDEIGKKTIDNMQLKKYNVTPRLTDSYLIKDLNIIYNNKIKEMYEFYCRFIHFSDSSLFSVTNIKNENILEISCSKDYSKFEKPVLENANSFIELSKFILTLLKKEWVNIRYYTPLC